jgi:hypothetical protein
LAKGVAGLGAATLSGCSGIRDNSPANRGVRNLIRRETNGGTRDWPQRHELIPRRSRSWIEGYCSRRCSCRGFSKAVCQHEPGVGVHSGFYRKGFYGGDGGREVLKLVVQGDARPPVGKIAPRMSLGIVRHNQNPRDWLSGVSRQPTALREVAELHHPLSATTGEHFISMLGHDLAGL